MRKYKGLGKRILAVIMAALTVVTTASIDFDVIAAEYGGHGTSAGFTISSGGAVAQKITCNSNYERLDKASFKIVAEPNVQYNYTVKVYENLTDDNNPESGVLRATIGDSFIQGASREEKTIDIAIPAVGDNDGKPIVLTQNETAAVVVELRSAPSGSIMYYEGTNTGGYRKSNSMSGWEERGNILKIETEEGVQKPQDITVEVPNKIIMTNTDADLDITPVLTPAYKRNITFNPSAGTTNVSVISNKVHPINEGKGIIDVSSEGDYKTSTNIWVVENQLSASSFEYTGSEIKPGVTVKCGGILTEGIDYKLTYSNNVEVGTGSVTIDGLNDYQGYQKTYDFEITKAHITQAMVDAGTYTINTSNNKVTNAVVGSLVMGTDFTATATVKSTTVSTITYNVAVKGMGSYEAETYYTDVTVTAGSGTTIDINSVVTAEIDVDTYDYTGSAITPLVTFKNLNGDIISGFEDNVDVIYANNVNATYETPATITITGKASKGYEGEIVIEYNIEPVSIKSSKVTIELEAYSFAHTGDEIKPNVSVKFESGGVKTSLVKDQDYTIVYRNNEDIGQGTVIVSGIGNFKDSKKEYFEIVGDFEKDSVVSIGGKSTNYNKGFFSSYSSSYKGTEIKPSVVVSIDGVGLNQGIDYDLSFVDNIDAGTAIVRLTGKGDYAGKTIDAKFTITPAALNGSFNVYQQQHFYNGSPQKLSIAEYDIKQNAITLTEDVDYELSYTNNINAGTAYVTATGKGNYSGTLDSTFVIDRLGIGDQSVTVEAIPDYTYTGAEIRPIPVVRVNGTQIPTTNYTVSYSNNKEVGTATVNITGVGNFVGTRTETFQIKAQTLEGKTFYLNDCPCSGSGSNLTSTYVANYTGGEVQPVVKILDSSGRQLQPWVDYSTGYTSNINAGTAYIFIIGRGAYSGSQVRIAFSINAKSIESSDVTVTYTGLNEKIGDYTYPIVNVRDAGAVFGKENLVKDIDYEVVVDDTAKTSGEGKIARVKGKGNYQGVVDVTYNIGNTLVGNTILDLYKPGSTKPEDKYTKSMTGDYNVPYLGNYSPNVVATYINGTPVVLTKGVDYDLVYESLVPEAGGDIYTAKYNNKVKVSVVGKGDYYGTISSEYYITKKPIVNESDSSVTIFDGNTGDISKTADWTYVYNGNVKKVLPMITYKPTDDITNNLVKDVDYTVSISPAEIGPDVYYTDGGAITTVKVTVTGIGNYLGSKVIDYIINPFNVDSTDIVIDDISDQPYTGMPINPIPVVKRKLSGGATVALAEGVDYTVEFQNNIDVGQATVVIKGKGNYTGTNSYKKFNIVQRDLGDGNTEVSKINDVIYDGTPKTPTFNVYYNKKLLQKGVDYKVTYIDNVRIGAADPTGLSGPRIQIEGIGAYKGTYSTSFSIRGNIADSDIFEIDGLNSEYIIMGSDIVLGTINVKYKDPDDGHYIIIDPSNYDIITQNTSMPGTGTISFVGKNALYGTLLKSVKVIGGLQDATFTSLTAVQDYTGSQVKPNFTLAYKGRVLKENVDYKVTYGTNTDVGGGSIHVEAIPGGYYDGFNDASFFIKYNIDKAVVTGYSASYPYTGAQITPGGLSVKCEGMELSEGAEYVLSYGANTNVIDGGQITITAIGDNAKGAKTVQFKINPLDMDASTCTAMFLDGPYTYSGSAIQPQLGVKYGGARDLELLKDYTVTYSNNINAGTGNARITGTGNYRGAFDVTFDIAQANINDADITVLDAYYAGDKAVVPQFSVYYNGKLLLKGTENDYTYTVSNNVGIGTGHITFTGSGNNFIGEITKDFEIKQTDLSNGKILVDSNRAEYTGSVIPAQITVLCPTGEEGEYYTLKKDIDYEIKFNDVTEMIDAGIYSIKVTGLGGFFNTLNTTFEVTPKSVNKIEEISYTYDENFEYTGSAIEPSVIVKDTARNVELAPGVDYDIEYLNNVNSGSKDDLDESKRPTIKITGLGNYGEERSLYFNIGHSIDSVDAAISQSSITYDGLEHKPAVSAKLGETDLVEGVDFNVVYEAADGTSDLTNAGDKVAKIVGCGGYYGGKTLNYTINPKTADASKILIVPNLPKDEEGKYIATYNGKPITPQAYVYDLDIDEVTPLRSEDYVIDYRKNTDVSSEGNEAEVIAHLQGNYDVGGDDYTQKFIIKHRPIEADFEVTLVGGTQHWYTGLPIEPDVKVVGLTPELVKKDLVKDVDYKVTYSDNVNAGEATATIEGIGNYQGVVERKFNVVGNLADAVVEIEDQFYTGEPVHAPIKVWCAGNELVEGVDYKTTYYSDDNYESTGKVIITPLKPYYSADSVIKTYNIIFDPTMLRVEGYANEYTYTGMPVEPDFKVVTPAGTEVNYDKTKIKYVNSNTGDGDTTSIGTVTATIPLNVGSKTCEVVAVYDIIGRNINICDMVPLIDNTYTGKVITPPVIIRCNGELLQEGVDYTLEYSDNINPGVGTIKVTGIGNFIGDKILHFNIISPQVVNLVGTALNDTTVNLTWTKNPHVTGYEVYSEDSLIKYGATTEGYMNISGLKQATTYNFKVRSYITINGQTTFGEFKKIPVHTGIAAPAITVASYAKGRSTINWNTNTNVTGYEIYRSISPNGTYSKIAVMPKTAGGYTDSGLVSNGTYYYKVRAYEKVGENEFVYGYFSDAVSVKVK